MALGSSMTVGFRVVIANLTDSFKHALRKPVGRLVLINETIYSCFWESFPLVG